ncbi:putative UDP-glucose lipid carrier transferase [Rhabdaerophilaceae bacterium]
MEIKGGMAEANKTGDFTSFIDGRIAGLFRPRPGSDPTLGLQAFSAAAALIECLVIMAAGYSVALVYLGERPELFAEYILPIPLMAAATVAIFNSFELYDTVALRRSPYGFGRLFVGWLAIFLLAFAVIFFLKFEGVYSRVVFASWFGVGLTALVILRFAIARLGQHLGRSGFFQRRAILVGGGAEASAFLKAMGRSTNQDLQILGLVDDRGDTRSPEQVADIKKLGTVENLPALVRSMPIDVVIFTLPVVAEQRIITIMQTLNVLPIDIRLAAHSQQLRFAPRHYLYFGSLPAFSISDRPVAGWSSLQKKLFDRIVGGLLLLLLSPLMLLIAILVRLDSRGPSLFRQKRFGFNNEPIEVLKFRSMYVDQTDWDGSKQVTRDDPRVTRIGRFLRRSSLDELPQLINVAIYGTLSLVGPRPHAFQAKAGNQLYEDVIHGYFARHRVKPGITGWAQVNGWRGETDTAEKIQKRVEHDLHYIENWSLAFDCAILVMTPIALLRGDNAY